MAYLKKLFIKTPVKWKIIFIILSVCIPSTIIGLSAVCFFDSSKVKEELKNNLKVSAEMTSDHLSASLAFGDQKNARNILKSFNRNESIAKACLYTHDGSLFAEYFKAEALISKCSMEIEQETAKEQSSFIIHTNTINEKALNNLGTLIVYSDLSRLSKVLYKQALFVIGCLFFVLLAISYPLAHAIQNTISRPINELYEKSLAISNMSHQQLRNHSSLDEIHLSIQMLEEIRGFAEVYYESIEATQAALNNHKHLIDMLNDKLKSRKNVQDLLSDNLKNTAYDNVVEVAERSIEMQTLMHYETEDLLDIFTSLYHEQRTILSTEQKAYISKNELEALFKKAFKDIASHNSTISIATIDSNWSVKIYEQALLKTLEGVERLFEALSFKNGQYKINIVTGLNSHNEINLYLERLNNSQNAFDFDHNQLDFSLLKVKYFNNINNPNPNSVSLKLDNNIVQITVLL